MNALIIDDELKAREILELHIKLHVPEITSVRLANGGSDANLILKSFNADLVLLDIKMPGLNGFEWLKSLNQRPFDVIFTTAYDQYAIQAIRYAAFDYLLKPVDPEDLCEAIKRYIDRSNTQTPEYENLLFNIGQNEPSQFRLTISTMEGAHYFLAGEIIRCAADGNYTHFYLTNDRYILASKPLGYYAGLLPEALFLRCHKSTLVNKLAIAQLIENQLKLTTGEMLEVSRRRLSDVRSKLAHGQ